MLVKICSIQNRLLPHSRDTNLRKHLPVDTHMSALELFCTGFSFFLKNVLLPPNSRSYAIIPKQTDKKNKVIWKILFVHSLSLSLARSLSRSFYPFILLLYNQQKWR